MSKDSERGISATCESKVAVAEKPYWGLAKIASAEQNERPVVD
jgi:hypothetical protein